MLTLFAIPKPFTGHIGLIQRNAIQSWLQLRPACEIILFGDEQGTAEVVREFGLRHVPCVAKNEYGTPLLSAIFKQVHAVASHRLLAYLNADIIVLSDFIEAVRRIPFRRFLMVGQCCDIILNEQLDFSRHDLQADLYERGRTQSTPRGRGAIDYFVFPSPLWKEVPPFAVGRCAWDNWMIYSARTQGIAVVDASQSIMAIHQNHDYAHLEGGSKGTHYGPEGQRNLALAGGKQVQSFILDDALWSLPRSGIVLPAMSLDALRRHWANLSVLSMPVWRTGLMRTILLILFAFQADKLIKGLFRRTKRVLARISIQ